jgi:hypothetical protein
MIYFISQISRYKSKKVSKAISYAQIRTAGGAKPELVHAAIHENILLSLALGLLIARPRLSQSAAGYAPVMLLQQTPALR